MKKWDWNDVWIFAVVMFILYAFVSCCANDIAEAYRKANNPITVKINK